ncbi:alpha/beta hydrolase [Streptomyces sp. NPDC048504]|uniref:alpha/beta hydrolase n=1 Tax=Streptomyces sp. NPDC048504 TaxID=3365559 RepID=UPI0037230329
MNRSGAAPAPRSPGVRTITLDADGVTLSALLLEAEQRPPRAVVVALHGGGMNAGYFDGQAHPHLSLLTLGASLGYTVLALDRPGYRHSATRLPEGQSLADQADSVHAALDDFTFRYETGAGLFLLAHSYGGKVALSAAADPAGGNLLGLDISGCGHTYAVARNELPGSPRHGHWMRNWGPLRLYPPNTFRNSASMVAPMPERERAEVARWPELFREVASRVLVPVRLTFAEHEAWWRHDEVTLAGLAAGFSRSPRVVVDRQPDAGHNMSLGWAARSYHLRAHAFFEECLARYEATTTVQPERAS